MYKISTIHVKINKAPGEEYYINDTEPLHNHLLRIYIKIYSESSAVPMFKKTYFVLYIRNETFTIIPVGVVDVVPVLSNFVLYQRQRHMVTGHCIPAMEKI